MKNGILNLFRFCPSCKKQRKTLRELVITRLPNFLLIHLKRFTNTGPARNKIDSYIDFPIVFNFGESSYFVV